MLTAMLTAGLYGCKTVRIVSGELNVVAAIGLGFGSRPIWLNELNEANELGCCEEGACIWQLRRAVKGSHKLTRD